MQKPFWRVNFEHARYGLTGFRLQSFVCFVVTISVGFILRLTTVVWGVSARCVEADQFWFEPYKNDWPVGGTFLLAIFLLLAWNTIIFINQRLRDRNDLILTIANFVAIAAMIALSVPAYESAQLRYDIRNETYGQWLVSGYQRWPYYEDKCLLAADYLGKWEVIDQHLPPHGAKFPGQEIEFKQTLKFAAHGSRWDEPVIGYWDPPSSNRRFRGGYVGAKQGH